ncbi:MAG: hypothetical protein RIB54_06470 [Fulvivirga sp.]|uniref:hypothetical protein n=2 Tax=Fulvivirga sp. TaxID=1931237 RepID=UPI0032ED490C
MLESEHLQHFTEIKGYFTGDAKIKAYFDNNFSNNTAQEIKMKLSCFRVPYLDNLKTGMNILASFIASLNLEPLMRTGSPDAVNRMTSFVIEEDLGFLEFATTYCNWHNHEGFPIYREEVQQLLDKLNCSVQLNNKDSYEVFSASLRSFRTTYNLEELNFKELDKFIWLFAKKVKSEV